MLRRRGRRSRERAGVVASGTLAPHPYTVAACHRWERSHRRRIHSFSEVAGLDAMGGPPGGRLLLGALVRHAQGTSRPAHGDQLLREGIGHRALLEREHLAEQADPRDPIGEPRVQSLPCVRQAAFIQSENAACPRVHTGPDGIAPVAERNDCRRKRGLRVEPQDIAKLDERAAVCIQTASSKTHNPIAWSKAAVTNIFEQTPVEWVQSAAYRRFCRLDGRKRSRRWYLAIVLARVVGSCGRILRPSTHCGDELILVNSRTHT